MHRCASDSHLWVFSSVRLNWLQLPPSFVANVSSWWLATAQAEAPFYSERVLVVSLVQPSGEIVTLSPAVLSIDPAKP